MVWGYDHSSDKGKQPVLEDCQRSLHEVTDSLDVQTQERGRLAAKCAAFSEEIFRLENEPSDMGCRGLRASAKKQSAHSKVTCASDTSTDRKRKFLTLQISFLRRNKTEALARFPVMLGVFSQGKEMCVPRASIQGYAIALGKTESVAWFRETFPNEGPSVSCGGWHARAFREFEQVERDFEDVVLPLLMEIADGLEAQVIFPLY